MVQPRHRRMPKRCEIAIDPSKIALLVVPETITSPDGSKNVSRSEPAVTTLGAKANSVRAAACASRSYSLITTHVFEASYVWSKKCGTNAAVSKVESLVKW